jgi:hypothetical protein
MAWRSLVHQEMDRRLPRLELDLFQESEIELDSDRRALLDRQRGWMKEQGLV